MSFCMLLVAAITSTAVNFIAKQFNKRSGGIYFYTMLAAVFSAIVFLFSVSDWSVSADMFFYSLWFAAMHCISISCSVNAYKYGSFALTVLIISYSLLIPTFYGILFLHEKITTNYIIGLVLVILSIFLTSNLCSQQKKAKHKKPNIKWIIFVTLAFLGGGMCSVAQRLGQMHCENASLTMVLAFFQVAVYCGILGMVFEKKEWRSFCQSGWRFSVICGIFNGITNLFVIILNTRINASIMFPVISAFMLLVSFVCSLCFYREKLNRQQIIGYFIGLVSVIILNC